MRYTRGQSLHAGKMVGDQDVPLDVASQCPSTEILVRFLSRELPEDERRQVADHLERCTKCEQVIRNQYSNLAPTSDHSGGDDVLQPTTIVNTAPEREGELLEDIQVGQTLGDFCLVQALGAGSFAKVFLARQESLQWLVALKVTRKVTDEAPALARMDHEHIVRIHGQHVLPDRDLLLVSTKYIAGGTLENVISQTHFPQDRPKSGADLLQVVDGILDTRGATIPSASTFREQLSQFDWPETVCWIGAKLASALDHAHARDVLHRDVKPANVLLTAEGSPMLADFNISFSNEVEGGSAATYFGGSLLYMSPEQLEACDPAHSRSPDQLDGRSDIYSLGLVLWELLTGKHPFIDEIRAQGGKASVTSLHLSRRQALPESALEQLSDDTPPGLTGALMKCLSAEVESRFAHARELSGVLQKQLVPGMRTLLHPSAESWRQRVFRHPLLAVVLAVLVPNLLLSPINIALNVRGIIDQAGGDQLLLDEQNAFWDRLMPLINGVIWPLPALLLVAYGWPMLRAIRERRQSTSAPAEFWPQRSQRTLRLGLVCSLVIFAAWLATGIAFPLGIDLALPDGKLGAAHYTQFIVSQAMHGLIAAAGTYFLVTFFCVHAIYPRLIPDEPPESDAQQDLTLVERWCGMYSAILGISPLLAIVALATIFWNKSPELRFVFVWLAILGEIGFLVAWTTGARIRRDIATLRAAVQTGAELFRSAAS